MVSHASDYNFTGVVDEFFALKTLSGPHADLLKNQVRERAIELISGPDVRYMPAFKILDLLANMVNIATSVASEPQLRAHEATALLRANLSDNAPLIRQFALEVALERVRYEPMILAEEPTDIPHRDRALRKRWQSMLNTHQAMEPIPADWETIIDDAVETVITSETFHDFRQGPLMQLFAEMLQTARHIHREGASIDHLKSALGPNAPLWKRYALKETRYAARPDTSPSSLPAEQRIPDAPIPPQRRMH